VKSLEGVVLQTSASLCTLTWKRDRRILNSNCPTTDILAHRPAWKKGGIPRSVLSSLQLTSLPSLTSEREVMRASKALTRLLLTTGALWLSFVLAAASDEESVYDPTKPLEDPSLTWGTYRPQIYFGIRSALPHSLLSGLLWFTPQRYESFVQARHDCDDGDKIKGYGWKYHDGRSFAIQEIQDVENNYVIETSWLKTGHESSKGTKGHSGSWAVRIKGTVIDSGKRESKRKCKEAFNDFHALFQQTAPLRSHQFGTSHMNQKKVLSNHCLKIKTILKVCLLLLRKRMAKTFLPVASFQELNRIKLWGRLTLDSRIHLAPKTIL
jgi:hypothetical protein